MPACGESYFYILCIGEILEVDFPDLGHLCPIRRDRPKKQQREADASNAFHAFKFSQSHWSKVPCSHEFDCKILATRFRWQIQDLQLLSSFR